MAAILLARSKVDEHHSDLITRPPSDLRRVTRPISINSQVKPIRNTDRAGNPEPRSCFRQIAYNTTNNRRVVVENNFAAMQPALTLACATLSHKSLHQSLRRA
jgi:hypothetical protein